MSGIVDQLFPRLATQSLGKMVRIVRGPTDPHQDLAGLRVHGYYGAALSSEGLLRGHLEFLVKGQNEIEAGLRLQSIHEADQPTLCVRFDLLPAIDPSDKGIQPLLYPRLPHGISGTKVPVRLLVQLLLVHLAYISDEVGGDATVNVGAERTNAEAHARQIRLPLFDDHHRPLIKLLRQKNRSIRVGPTTSNLGDDLFRRLPQNGPNGVRGFVKVRDRGRDYVHIKRGTVLHNDFARPIEDEPSRGLYRAEPEPVAGGKRCVVPTLQHLEVPEPQQE
jgi:hypothetical protein